MRKSLIIYIALLDAWKSYNFNIITWINNFVVESVGTQLATFDMTQGIRDYFDRMYIQSNISKLYQFEADVRALQQNTMSVHDFFVAVLIYEIQLALKEYHEMKAC